MTDSKILRFASDKPVKKRYDMDMTITIGAQVKYCDDEVVIVKTTVDFAGESESSHIMVEIPKE